MIEEHKICQWCADSGLMKTPAGLLDCKHPTCDAARRRRITSPAQAKIQAVMIRDILGQLTPEQKREVVKLYATSRLEGD